MFLVDRANLGEQTFAEFENYSGPDSPHRFVDEYTVQHLTSNTIGTTTKVVITTIQRLYSMLKGEEHFDEAGEDGSQFEAEVGLIREPLPVVYNPHPDRDRSTSSWSMSAIGRSTTSGGRCSNTSTPS